MATAQATFHTSDLKEMPILLSASIPDRLRKTPRAQELFTAIATFVQHIIAANGRVIFGGHPEITPLVRQAALNAGGGTIELFQLQRFRAEAPQDIWDTSVFSTIHWFGSADADGDMAGELNAMRQAMGRAAAAAIFIGGRTRDFKGDKSGIRDEYDIFLQHHPDGPVYLLGLLAGETLNIIREIERRQQKEPNQLSDSEQKLVHHSANIDVISPLIIADLAKYVT
jgi:hypothetical protein